MSVGRRARVVHVDDDPSGYEGLTTQQWLDRFIQAHEERHSRNAEEIRHEVENAARATRDRDEMVLATHEREHDEQRQHFDRYVADHEARHERDAANVLQALHTAIDAVAERANLHSTAHEREHAAHEAVHHADAAARQSLASMILTTHEKEHHAHDAVHDADRIAITKADEAMTRRLEAMNEFRSQLREQSLMFATKESVSTQLQSIEREARAERDALRSRIETLEKGTERAQGKGAGLAAGWGYLVAGIGVVVLVVNLVFYLISR